MPKIPRSVATTFTLLLFAILFVVLTPSSAEIGYFHDDGDPVADSGLARIANSVFDMLTEPFSSNPDAHGMDESMFSADDTSLSVGSPLDNLRGILEKRPYIIEHIVEPGDTIWSIMKAYNVDEATIVNANDLINPSKLKVGQTLTFPSVTGLTHTVKKGDTIFDLAKTYQVSSQIIEEANELTDGSSIQIGQVLVIPGGKLPRTASRTTVAKSSSSSSKTAGIGITLIHPIASGTRITSNYGSRSGRMHYGTDFGVSPGTPVKAAASGVVTTSGWSTGYGKLIVIDHGQGVKTCYAHNSQLLFSSGDRVEQGQVIAISGNTGRSTGPHLHFEVRVNNKAQNPLNYIKK